MLNAFLTPIVSKVKELMGKSRQSFINWKQTVNRCHQHTKYSGDKKIKENVFVYFQIKGHDRCWKANVRTNCATMNCLMFLKSQFTNFKDRNE